MIHVWYNGHYGILSSPHDNSAAGRANLDHLLKALDRSQCG